MKGSSVHYQGSPRQYERRKIVLIDKEGVGHGVYHPDEYLGVGEELARKYAVTYGRQIAEEVYRLDNML